MDKKKKYEKEIEHYKKCINIIKESYNDKDEINTISFRLGTAYYKNNNLDKAITVYIWFLDILIYYSLYTFHINKNLIKIFYIKF